MKRFVILLSVLFLSGLSITASAQSSNVVINEFDINPPGDDAKSAVEWVELYNPTNSKIDIGGWQIAPSTLKKTLVIPNDTSIGPGQFLTFLHQSLWFTDANEQVELKDKNGTVVDRTPLLSDVENDFRSWQRIYDGYDFDTNTDWKFAISTAGSSNGKLSVTKGMETNPVSISVSVDKSSYLFGETVIIQGSVSKQLFVTSPSFSTERIFVKISGPNYDKTISLYPDLNLNYKTSLNLQRVLGINQGNYSVLASYGDSRSQINFSVNDKTIVSVIPELGTLNITTDKTQYLPGDTLLLTGLASQVIPLEGLKFSVKDPDGKVISTGNLYPTNGKFSTKIFLTTVNPVYGKYQINGEYLDKRASAFFEVIQDFKEEKIISLWTDKEAYGLGETVTVTGRLNKVWIGFMDLEIIQTSTALDKSTLDGKSSDFKILDVVKISGDGSFTYSFKIPDSSTRLGDYKISISKDLGAASKVIQVVSNTADHVTNAVLFSVSTDKVIYDLGDSMTINGFIGNYITGSNILTFPVEISIFREDGRPLEIVALPPGAKTRQDNGLVIAYEFTTTPDSSGRFSVQTKITQNVFTEGSYKIKAQYRELTKITNIGITNPLKSDGTILLTLDKDVYGLGESLNLTGLLPPIADGSLKITLIKPDGSIVDSGATVNNQRFSWSWITPISEKPLSIKIDDRSVSSTNYGIYKINVFTPSGGKAIFFKVSSDPTNDSLSLSPLDVSTEKSIYKAGEKLKVIGSVIKKEQSSNELLIPQRVTILVLSGQFPFKQISEASVYPDQGGSFQSLIDLPVTIFPEGQYKIKASYSGYKSESTFAVANDFSFGSDEKLSLLLVTDKPKYYPGDLVVVSGKPNKLIYIEKFDVSVTQKADGTLTCGTFFCGKHVGPVTTIRPNSSGSFSHQIQLPNSISSLGSYEVTVDAGFATKSLIFDVIEKPVALELEKSTTNTLEKVNRILEDKISVTTKEKTIDDSILYPRVFSGSLVAAKNDQTNVNLRVTSESGVCVIGPEDNCAVKDSTKKSGQIYDIVKVDGMNLKVRYSGPSVYLEKFDILPESPSEFLSDGNWNIDVIKENQGSRFYYKINYKVIE